MSKIKVNEIEAQSGSTITIPTGQTLTVTDGIPATNLSGTIADARLPTIPVAKGGTGLTSLGSAGQAIKVNSGGNALEFGVAGGLLQVKTFRKSSAWSLGSTGTDRVEAAPFDGTASITPSATDSVIMATCNFVIKHGQNWRSGIGRLQFSTDGGSNYTDFGMMTASAYNDGSAMSGNDYSGTFIIPNQNTTNAHKVRLFNMPHNNGHNNVFGGSTDTDVADSTGNVSTYGTGATLTLFEFAGAIHTLSTTA